MKTNTKLRLLASLLFAAAAAPGPASAQTTATNKTAAKDPAALRDVVILIIRHAEKPDTGMDLIPAGVARANAYTNYFRNYIVDSKPWKPDHLFAAADSKNSRRPRLTLEPLAKSLGMTLDTRFKDKQPQDLADEIESKPQGRNLLICWHHGQIPDLIKALGADPEKLLPGGKWPDDVFNWVIQLRYDKGGRLIPAETKCVNQNLMPGDADKKTGAS